ncbi:MAG: lysine exporter LysO family protein [Halanaerobium sp.]
MDFYLIIFFLFSGVLLGFWLDKENYFVKFADLITKIGLVILLLAMGANLGSDQQIVLQLGEIGFQALIFAAVSIIFSLLAVIIFVRVFSLNSLLLSADPETEAEIDNQSGDKTMTVLIFSSVIIGILFGYFILNGSERIWIDLLTNYSLAVLLFGVGIDIGASREILKDLRLMGWKLLVIPILIALGSLVGSVISGLAFGFTAGESAAVGSGFGWYSLSGVLISKLHSAELGSLAFLSNVFRELLTVMILPLVVRYFGSLAAVAPGGATTMDVTLPLVKESGGEAVVIPAFVSGAVLSTLVPILVPLFLSFSF